jgi:hypothetical protein
MGPDRRDAHADSLAGTIGHTCWYTNTDAHDYSRSLDHAGTYGDAWTDSDTGPDRDTCTDRDPDSLPDRDTDLLRK